MATGAHTTPLVRLQRVSDGAAPALFAKCEFQSPTGSNKDRVARKLLQALGTPTGPTTYVIPTSGNLAISIATLVVPHGHKIVVVVPEKTTSDKIATLKALGADIYRTNNRAVETAPDSYVGLARKLASQIPNAVLIDEFDSAANVLVHYEETAEEILVETQGKVDVVVIPVESAGTLVGVAKKLKERIPSVQIVAVDAKGSALSQTDRFSDIGSFRSEAIGNSFVPHILQQAPSNIIDRWIIVNDKEAFSAARRLIREEGLLVGSSSGAAFVAAQREAANLRADQKIVVLFNDSARNYSSTLLNDSWLISQGLLNKATQGDRYRGAAVAELNLPTPVSIGPQTTVAEAVEIMDRENFDQLPVLYNKKLVGYVSLGNLRPLLTNDDNKAIHTVDRWMHIFSRDKKYEVITPETLLSELDAFFEKSSVAFVTDTEAQWCIGVVTKSDLVNYLEHRR